MLSLSEQHRAIKSIKVEGYYVFKSILKVKEIDKYTKILHKQKSKPIINIVLNHTAVSLP